MEISKRVRVVATVAGASLLALGASTPAFAGGGSTSDMPGHDQACGTQTDNGTTQCFATIQQAIDYAGAAGTVNVGPGQFDEHVSIIQGVTVRGSGNDTQIQGALDTPLITVVTPSGSPMFQSPVTIENLELVASSGATSGYGMVIKDRNTANLDSVSNVSFTEQSPSQRDYGLDNESSGATLAVSNNTFRGMSVGVLIDVNSATSSGPLGADLVSANSFDQLTSAVGAPKGIDISLNSGGNSVAGSQVFNGNEFNFNGGSAVSVDGSGTIGSISVHEDNFKGPDFGVSNSSGSNVDATDTWWGCPDGPTGTQPHCVQVGGTVSYKPWLTHPADLHAGNS
ncbi:MAG: hypothetical protein ACRDXE_03975 [Acidimicrobiales bacterium]